MSYEIKCPHCDKSIGTGHNANRSSSKPDGAADGASMSLTFNVKVPENQKEYLAVPPQKL